MCVCVCQPTALTVCVHACIHVCVRACVPTNQPTNQTNQLHHCLFGPPGNQANRGGVGWGGVGDGAGVSPDESPLSWFIITEEKMTMGDWPRRKSMVVARGWELEVRGLDGEGREVVMVMGGGGEGGLVVGGRGVHVQAMQTLP